MDHVSDQEQRTGKMYRVLLVAFIAVVAVLSIWLVIPPKPLELGFLRGLHPKVTENEKTSKALEFKAKMAEVEKVLDTQLTPAAGWIKDKTGASGSFPGYVSYRHPGRGVPSLSLSASYGPIVAPPKPGVTPTPPVNGSRLEINDPRDVTHLP